MYTVEHLSVAKSEDFGSECGDLIVLGEVISSGRWRRDSVDERLCRCVILFCNFDFGCLTGIPSVPFIDLIAETDTGKRSGNFCARRED